MQLNRQLVDADHYYAEFIQAANLEYDLSENVGAFTEFTASIPCGRSWHEVSIISTAASSSIL